MELPDLVVDAFKAIALQGLHASKGRRFRTRVSEQLKESSPTAHAAANGERHAHRVPLILRVNRLEGRGGMSRRLQPQQSRCFSAVQATRAEMSDRGVSWQISVSRHTGRGGSSCLSLAWLQSRYLSAMHAASAEMSVRRVLRLQSRCSR